MRIHKKGGNARRALHETLGDNALPTHYSLRFDTDLKRFRFACDETVFLSVKGHTTEICMNARELDIKDAYAICNGKTLHASVHTNKKKARVTFRFGSSIVGKVELHISFEGTNNDRMYGFYRSIYYHNGREAHMLSTQFEPVDARSAFVCFDEPAFKATFGLSLVINEQLTAISNMPIMRETRLGEGRKVVEFEKTPRMSCYLLYMGIGRFERKERRLGKLRISAVTVPGQIRLAEMALDFCVRFTRFFQDYFGIDFPLPKIDLIAVPDFAAGAMENWGAIAFRDADMLGDPKYITTSARERIAETVAHELAHQWFGDLVTMSWWDDLWLNESFATFMSYKAMDSVFPEWSISKQYYISVMGLALSADSRNSTHPVAARVSTPAEIDSIFDPISYEKGGTVLHMLESYAGKEAFRNGLHDYLSRHAYGNAEGKDLWNAISRHSKRQNGRPSVSEFAETWITRKGHPIIRMDAADGSVRLEQRRFSISGTRPIKEAWPVPIDYVTKTSKAHDTAFMSRKSMTMRLDQSVIGLNHHQNYMYRVEYSAGMLEEIGAMIKDGRLDSVDALGVVRDLFSMTRSAMIPLERYLDFIESYCMDVQYPAYNNIANGLSWTLMMVEGTKAYDRVAEISINFHKNIIRRLGWDSSKKDTNIDLMTRESSIGELVELEDKDTVEKLLAMYGRLIKGHDIKNDKLSPALGAAARNGTMSTFNQIVKMYKREKLPERRLKYLHSLGRFRDKSILKKALEFNMTTHVKIQDKSGRKGSNMTENENVRIQDRAGIPLTASMDIRIQPVVWKWTKRNWHLLMREFHPGAQMLNNFVEIGYIIHTEDGLENFRGFFSKRGNLRPDIKEEYRDILESIRANIRFFKRNGLG